MPLGGVARQLLECLQERGACFFQELVQWTRQLPAEVEEGLRELVAWGLVTCDGLAGLRSLTSPLRRGSTHQRHSSPGVRYSALARQRTPAGRWSLLHRPSDGLIDKAEQTELLARELLRRYGVVFPRILLRGTGRPPWRELLRVYRRLEARGEVRGGLFVAGFSGEQYALPEAVQNLRAVRKRRPDATVVTVNGADPLNLVGILTPGARVPALPSNRLLYRAGVPIAVVTGKETTYLERSDMGEAVEQAAVG